MDLPPLNIDPPAPLPPIHDTPPHHNTPGVVPHLSGLPEEAWAQMAQEILSRAPRMFSMTKMIQRFHPVPQPQAMFKKAKVEQGSDKPISEAIVRQVASVIGERGERLATQFSKIIEQMSKAPPQGSEGGLGRCGAVAQKLAPQGAAVERVPLPFESREKEVEKPVRPPQPDDVKKPDVERDKPAEKHDEKQPIEDRDRPREVEKLVDKKRDMKETAVSKSEASTAAPVTSIPQRIPPEVFLGLGSLLLVAQRIATSPEFRAAKATLIVVGQRQKVFVQHVLKSFGAMYKQIYVWSLEELSHLGSAWSFLLRVKMPSAVLLDLDRGKKNGGWARIKWVLRTLLTIHGGKMGELSLDDIDLLPHWDAPMKGMERWTGFLEEQGIFFFQPLDFDFSLLQAFPDLYLAEAIISGSPTDTWKRMLDAPPHLMGYSEEEARLIDIYYALFVQENPLLAHQEVWRKAGVSLLIQHLPDAMNRAFRRMLYYCGGT